LQLEKEIIELKAQQKIDALNARMEQLEKGETGGINGVLSNLMQNEAIQQVVAGWLINATGMQAPKALAGLSHEVETTIERLKRVDKDFENHLSRLADLAENNPKQYFMALKFL
jgi:formate dehydrogenase maturation protein FdhE